MIARCTETAQSFKAKRLQAQWGLSRTREDIEKAITNNLLRLIREDGKQPQGLDKIAERVKVIAEWLGAGKSSGLILAGYVGTGKTEYCKAIKVAMQGEIHEAYTQAAMVVTAQQICDAAESDGELYEEYKNAKLLCIDDLGTEAAGIKTYGNLIYPVADVILYRYSRRNWRLNGVNSGLKTLVTTNLSEEERNRRYGPRIADRMKEYDKLIFREQSYREKQ